ncbi:MAG: DUF192 domain-containing protein [Candidatus Altiarchaeota archaeon]
MEIWNESKSFRISDNAELRASFWGRFRGLMLSKRKDIILAAKKDSVVDSTIHMMFMLYPIDVIWAADDMTVVDVRKQIKPSLWRMHKPKNPAKYVVEIATGEIKDTDIGDMIAFR